MPNFFITSLYGRYAPGVGVYLSAEFSPGSAICFACGYTELSLGGDVREPRLLDVRPSEADLIAPAEGQG